MYPMENWYVPVMIGAVVGVIAGYFVARKSAQEQKIHGGAPARALHYLGAAVFSGMPITSILTILMGGGFVRAVVTGFAIVGVRWSSSSCSRWWKRRIRQPPLSAKMKAGRRRRRRNQDSSLVSILKAVGVNIPEGI